MRRSAAPAVLLVLAACSSAPTTDRPQVPDRPEVQRPDGVEPDGLASMRDSIGEQRAAARDRENALVVKPNELSQNPDSSWWQDALSWTGNAAGRALQFWKLFGL